MNTTALQQERAQILQEMAAIDSLIRGHLSQQTFRGQRAGKTVVHGPYHLLQRHEQGRNNCQRVGPDELAAITDAVAGYRRFQELAERYAALTEAMTWNRQEMTIKKKFRRFWPPAVP